MIRKEACPRHSNGWGLAVVATTFGAITLLSNSARAQDFQVLHEFVLTDGQIPQTSLLQATSGFFYGTTRYGGNAGGQGTVFRIDASGNFWSIYSFPNDAEPLCALAEGTDLNF